MGAAETHVKTLRQKLSLSESRLAEATEAVAEQRESDENGAFNIAEAAIEQVRFLEVSLEAAKAEIRASHAEIAGRALPRMADVGSQDATLVVALEAKTRVEEMLATKSAQVAALEKERDTQGALLAEREQEIRALRTENDSSVAAREAAWQAKESALCGELDEQKKLLEQIVKQQQQHKRQQQQAEAEVEAEAKRREQATLQALGQAQDALLQNEVQEWLRKRGRQARTLYHTDPRARAAELRIR
jgi:hypothetical protein